jgi:hypothetical protein
MMKKMMTPEFIARTIRDVDEGTAHHKMARQMFIMVSWYPFSIQFLTLLDNGGEIWYDWALRVRRVRYAGTADLLFVDANGQFEKLVTHDGKEYF